ncbi:carboxylesterase/lipase family protein [Actinoallomurus acanthiterrae]
MQRSIFRVLCGAVLTAGALTAVPAGSSSADEAAVRVSDGLIRGTINADHRSYQGIPYAAPPVGPLRWRAPRPAPAWTGVRDATRPGSPCPSSSGRPAKVIGSEDCLFLNVETPRRRSGRLPVMVFVHGGGFTGGSGGLYDPTRLVTRGSVIAVTFNYRLGALGFLDHPALDDPYAGDFGLADQQAALRWVRRNIAAFGGDPGNVTLWGQSAGAFGTCAQLAAPGARGLFAKAIVESGPCDNRLLTRAVARRRGLRTAANLGCRNPQTAAACLRAKPFQELTGLGDDRVFTVHRRIAELPWLPVTGTPVLPLQPAAAIRLGRAAHVPLMLGGTRDEMRAFVAARYDAAGHPLTAQEYPDTVRALYGPGKVRAILAAYPLDRYATPSLALATLLTDDGRMLGACSQAATDDAAARRSPVFAYEFAEPTDYAIGDFPFGASHGSDLPYLLDGAYQGSNPPPLTGDRRILADRLIGFWTRFARTGAPGPQWSEYGRGTVLSFRADHIAPVDLSAEHQCGFWRSHR